MRKGTARRKRERSIILTKHEIHLLSSSSPITPKERYKLFLKLERISKHLINDLLVIMNSKHLKRWNADHEFLWRRINAQVQRFVSILPALNLEVATVYRFKIRYKKIGKERYYWKERDSNSSFSEKMQKPTYPIIGIKGGYIRRILGAAIEHNIIPSHESKAITLSEIRRRLRTETN